MSDRPAANASTHTNQRQMRNTRRMLDQSLERLASGCRVHKALEDDSTAGLNHTLRKKILALQQAQKNAQDGVTLLHTAELGLNEVHRLLQQMRELGQQATTETVGVKERVYLDIEYQTIKEEISNVTKSTKFQDTLLLNETTAPIEIQLNGMDFNFTGGEKLQYQAQAHAVTPEHLGIAHLRIDTKETSRSSLIEMENALTRLNTLRAELVLLQQKLHAAIHNMTILVENLTAANSQWRSTETLEEGVMANLQTVKGALQSPNLASSLATPVLSEP